MIKLNELHVINTDGRTLDYIVLGTVDTVKYLLDGSVVRITHVETTGYNTRVTFQVENVATNPFDFHGPGLIGAGILGQMGYVDFRNPVRNVLPGALSVFLPPQTI